MTIRNTGSRRKNSQAASTRKPNRLPNRKRETVRRTLLESLEQRQMMAGPQLTGIQPNEGGLLFDVRQLPTADTLPPGTRPISIQGYTQNVAPRELVFQFDGATQIDPSTLGGIRITRAGADGIFESATATTDFGTRGAAIVEFRSLTPGASGNGEQIRLTSTNRSGTSLPIIRVTDSAIEIDLNSNPARPTRVQDLLVALSGSAASSRIEAVQVSGPSLTVIGTALSGPRTLTLQGANAAQAVTSLGTTDGTLVRLIANSSGPDGRGIRVEVTNRDFGGAANPVVTVQGKTVRVMVNSTPGFQSTVNDFLNAINTNPEASQLVTAVLQAGTGGTSLATLPNNFAPLELTGAGDVVLTPGYVGIGDSPREIVFRFNENLPDDTYRIDILGGGAQALRNVAGEAFYNGVNLGIEFELNLGPQVVAVVPEPVRRLSNGQLSTAAGTIEVHFNDDDLLRSAAENRNFYQLVFQASNGGHVAVKPTSVAYSAITNIATLQFAAPLSRLPDPTSTTGAFLGGAFRLKIGTDEALPGAPIRVNAVGDSGDSFSAAFDLGGALGSVAGGTQSLIVDGQIQNTDQFPFQLPGGPGTPGSRSLRPDDPSRLLGPAPFDYYRLDENGDLMGDADNDPGITLFRYNFQPSFLGPDPTGGEKTYFNIITEQQKQRVREVMTLFSEYLGIQFVESSNLGTTIVVGDLYGANGDAVGGQGGLVGSLRPTDMNGDSFPDLGVLDFQDFDEADDDAFGGEFSRGAMLLVGQLIGFGFADDLPQPVTQSSTFVLNPGSDTEPAYPSVADILHGQFLYRPESSDVDLYQFTLDAASKVSAETFAERADDVSLLDTALRLYRRLPSGQFEEVAANDDYSTNDSFVEISLPAGTYVLGISASGNTQYDPVIPGTGFGGRSEGEYQLRLTVEPDQSQGLVDTTGIALDGDADGRPGGVFDFWYQPAEPLNPQQRNLELQTPGATVTPATIFVDKAAITAGSGSVQSPYREIDEAIAAARPGDVIRVVANGGIDGRISTAADNLSYQIGVNSLGQTLADGRTLEIPQGVTMVVDAGAVLKFRAAHVSVGSNSPTIDRSGGTLQVLGTPVIVEANGLVATDNLREPVPGSVYFTSYNDPSVGAGNAPTNLTVRPGDWGGIDFRGDVDSADESRMNLEDQGVFLNQIYGADIRYGGGQVSVAGSPQAISPIEIDVTRPTIAYSRITNSADSAIEATPASFAETGFVDYVAPSETGTVSDYRRVGPDIHNNTIVGNSINGLFIRTRTRTGQTLVPLSGQARFDDTDIVHVLTENLVIQGTPGGPIIVDAVPPSLLINGTAVSGGTLPAGTYVYRLSYADAAGSESPASDPTLPVTTTSTGGVRLTQLPVVPAGSPFVARRLYRAVVDASGSIGEFRLAGNLNGSSTTFTDTGALTGGLLVERPVQYRARLDASLTIDAGTVLKLDGSRIETSFGGNLIAEGREGLPIVMTSLNDRRYGGSGTFVTDGQSNTEALSPGDWAGLYIGYASSASIDHARIAGAGGVSRVEGGFASFNAIEVHQAKMRLTNSQFEDNASGQEPVDSGQVAADRGGRGSNGEGTVFVRGAAPTIVNNDFLGGSGAAISIDVNSMGFATQSDPGRVTGGIDRFDIRGNAGPLIRENQLKDNDLNGLLVRGGETTTEVVFDDTDITHIVLDTITIPNQHVFGGLRLQSSPEASLVVKFESRNNEVAGIVVGGSLLTAANQLGATRDRIGGSLQLVGFPDYPVVLTTLADDSAGGGFTPDGRPQLDTNNDGTVGVDVGGGDDAGGFTQLPFGPEVNNGTRIDNDVDPNIAGFFQATPDGGGSISFLGGGSGVTTDGVGGIAIDQDYIFEFLNYVDVGSDGGGIDLSTTTITQQPTLISDDRVRSQGTFQGQNGVVNWTVDTYFLDGVPVLFNSITFDSTAALGNLRLVNYLDEDVDSPSDDILFTTGTPGEADFRAYTIDGARRIGFSHGGYYETGGANLQNASYVGWAADEFPILRGDITGPGTQYTIAGNIDVAALPPQVDPEFGTAYGPNDVTTGFAWDVNPAATTATITSFLELVPRDPALPQAQIESGLWQGVTVREGASDRNVVGTPEAETTTRIAPGVNGIPGTAQFLGELAAQSRGGDENQRLGFVVDGQIATRDDLDVYSFVGRAGSEVWLDIDRTDMSFDSVIELIDANGNVLASSDNSAAESLDASLLYRSGVIDADSVKSMNLLPLDAQTLTAAQDQYSTNPRDAGMRMTLPGEAGTRNLYHVRVRSSNSAAGDVTPNGSDSPLVRGGLTQGSYRMQVRLREADEFPGTQVRFGDVRYGETNLRIIGQPFHSPLVGDDQEQSADNNARANAQPIGPYSLGTDANSPAAANLAASDRLSLSVGGEISSATDVDWYEFNINYQSLPAGSAAQYLSTVFDLDYADGYSRADMSLYVFNEAGQLILTGLNSNIADDQPRPGEGADSTDLSRGSAGTKDPYIGMAELPQGTYFVAVTNHSQVPGVLNQYYAPAGNPNVVSNPLLRLEPITSVRRIAEDHIGGGVQTADRPGTPGGPQLLFSQDSIIPLTLNDVVMYTMNFTGNGSQSSLNMNNPFDGTNFGSVGLISPEFQDFAVRPTGEFFGYNIGNTDAGWLYYRISSEDGAVTAVGSAGIQTFEEQFDADGNIVVVGSNSGMRVRALTYRDSDIGFFVADRPNPNGSPILGPDYTDNIVYMFNAATGEALSDPAPDRAPFTVGDITIDPRGSGAGTNIVERGFIDSLFSSGVPDSINVSAATRVAPDGTATWLLSDGDGFSVRDANGSVYRFEFNSGPDFRMRYDDDAGVFVRDGDQFMMNGVTYEFETGGAIALQAGADIADGSTITLSGQAAGSTRTFELTRDAAVASGNLPVAYTAAMTPGEVAAALAAAINNSDTGITADPLGTSGRIGLSGVSAAAAPVTSGSGIAFEGATGLETANAVAIRLEEGVSFEMFVDGIAAAAEAPVTVGVAGDRVNFRGATAGNDFSELVGRGIILPNPGTADGSYGNGTVAGGATPIDFLASDSAATIAARVAAAVNSAPTGSVSASSSGRTVSFTDAFLTRSDVEQPGSPLRLTNVAPGGTVTGVAMINGSMYAVSDAGGLYVVANPEGIRGGRMGTYVGSATDLLGIQFSGLSNGPRISYVDTWTNPGTSVTRNMENLLFGSTSAGRIFAFDRAGVLQPVFAGGATSIATGRAGMTGVEMSTLDYNLWHVTNRRENDPGHGVNADPMGTRGASSGGSSLYFGYAPLDEGRYQPAEAQGNAYVPANRPTTQPRLDGQPVAATYNFPGGAAGAMESDAFSLEGYTSEDLPYLYFNYFLGTDGVDGRNDAGSGTSSERIDSNNNADQDALHVYVVTPAGDAVLVATNNTAVGPFGGDDALDSVDGTAVGTLFDNVGWRQARVALSSFAGLNGLRLRIEFSTAGQMSNGTFTLRTVGADKLNDGQTATIGGQTFEMDFGSILTLPGGGPIAEYYEAVDNGTMAGQPERITLDIDGTTFVLSDGNRTINPGEVEILLALPDDPLTPGVDESKSIEQLTGSDVADLVQAALAGNPPAPTTLPGNVDFSVEPNDEMARATRLPRATGNTLLNGSGRIGTPTGGQLNDVDLSRIQMTSGERLEIQVTRTGGLLEPQIRLFNAAGRELTSVSGSDTATLSYVATSDGPIYIGINGGSNYDPTVAGSGSNGFGGTYDVVLRTELPFDPLQVGNRIQLQGASSASVSVPSVVTLAGAPGVASDNIRVPLQIDMNADQVALALQSAMARRFSDNATSAYPTRGGVIELGNLSVSDPGPFAVLGELTGDRFGAFGPGRAVDNDNEGVYLDDFVIGFAERGEMVTSAIASDTFAANEEPNVSTPSQPTDPRLTGSYQLEIRDGSEYVNTAVSSYFRTFDTNQRQVSGATRLLAPPANRIVDGVTFTISDGVRELTFEFDQVGSTVGVAQGNVRVPFDSASTSVTSAGDVARAIVDAINTPSVQSLLDVSALTATGVNGGNTSNMVDLFGSAIVNDPSGLLGIVASQGRGDSNREQDDQGVIIVENSRFSYAAEYGIDINHGNTSTIDGQTTPNMVRYPRNLVELNTGGLVPGVVIQSNTVAFSGTGGIRVQGLDDTGANINPVPFDRIINNTIVGGTITPRQTTPAEVFQGTLFPGGTASFADAVVAYTPLSGGGPQPGNVFRDPTEALGAPDENRAGPEPVAGAGTVSLGYGGSITLSFTDNLLTGDGTPAPDLVVFEVGEIESVSVEVSRDGVVFIPVGVVGGLSNRIDIDAFGLTPQDRLGFVRLTDLRQGDRNSLTVGADIDAVGALSNVPADVYAAGGTGIIVAQNAAPALINNVIANNEFGITADNTSVGTVSGANAFYRNDTNVSGSARLGQFTDVLPASATPFVAPTNLVFDPASGSQLIDSSIDSLADRPQLVTVRGPLGLEPSPILAPRLDINGQLRVDDPLVDSPSGLGENIFKDRGAADRADKAGPVGRLILPSDNDAAGADTNLASNAVSVSGSGATAFEIQLTDGVAPSDPVPGVGIDDNSVTSASVLVLRDNVPLVEGVDYRFAYQPSTNIIRLTPLAGVWQDDSVYTIRLLDSNDSVFVASNGDQYNDGGLLNLVDANGQLTTFEIETGISIRVPNVDGQPQFLDGTTFTIFDGVNQVQFEIDINNAILPGRTPISLRTNMTLADVTAAYITAINNAGLGLTATASDGDRIQLTGTNVLSAVDPLDSQLTTSGQIGVAAGYGLRIPIDATGQLPTAAQVDGQTFAIRRGTSQVVNFEINVDGVLNNPGYVPVNVSPNATLDQATDALVQAIAGAGLGLDPVNAGFGRVALAGDASYSIELTDTDLQVMGVPGQQASVPIPLSIAPDVTADDVATIIANAINAQQPAGVTTSVVGPRVLVNGAIGITGIGVLSVVTIRDRVGNLLQSNQPDGTTQYTVFLGAGFDYGDAPEPMYGSNQQSGGPRHTVTPGFSLGATVSPDADAAPDNGDDDDGVRITGPVYSGFDAPLQVYIADDIGGSFVLDYWVDWNRDGVFASTEKAGSLTSTSLSVGGWNNIPVAAPRLGTAADGLPVYSVAGETFARFRLSREGVASPLGDAPSGEVEDFAFTIQVNPFQNADPNQPNSRFDVNGSGDVSPIDILQVINALNRFGTIELDPSNPPTEPPYLDVNGDGRVTPIDALQVLNYLEDVVSGTASGEAGRTYVATDGGVLASAATFASPVGPAPVGAAPVVARNPNGEQKQAASAEQFSRTVVSPTGTSAGSTVFDSASVIALDEVLDTLAREDRQGDEEDGLRSIYDSVFEELGQ